MSEETNVGAAQAATKEKAPGAVMALVFGIIAWCTCWGPIGVVFGFLTFGKAKKAKAAHASNPDQYKSPKVFVIIGKIGAWIGIVVGLIYSIIWGLALVAGA
jgi:hypothetical protein